MWEILRAYAAVMRSKWPFSSTEAFRLTHDFADIEIQATRK